MTFFNQIFIADSIFIEKKKQKKMVPYSGDMLFKREIIFFWSYSKSVFILRFEC